MVVQDAVYWLNNFPTYSYISNTLSPYNIVFRTPNIDFKHLKLKYFLYAQVHIGTINTTKAVTVADISLFCSNEKLVYYFMSLSEGIQIK